MNVSTPTLTALPESPPAYTIVGTRVGLSPLRHDLLPTYRRWRDDARMNSYLPGPSISVLLDEDGEWDTDLLNSDEHTWFTIYELGTHRPIGLTGLVEIDLEEYTAQFFIYLGEADARSKGYGSESVRLMLDYAFAALELESVMLMVYEFNLASRRTYEKAGFHEFGRRRQSHLIGNRLWDVIYMECQAHDFAPPGWSMIPQWSPLYH